MIAASMKAPDHSALRHGLSDRLVALLDLPCADTEIDDLAAMMDGALEVARQTDRSVVLSDALRFVQGRLALRGIVDVELHELGAALVAAVGPTSSAERVLLRTLIAGCMSHPVAPPSAPHPHLSPLSAAYVGHLLRGDRSAALALTRQCVTDGMDVVDILVDVLEPAQREVGGRWALGLVSVAQEHFCTAVTEFAMADLYPGIFTGELSPRRLLAVRAPGSQHSIGLRMVTDVLECRGWSTTYVGAEVAVDALPVLVAEDRSDLLLISASMPGQVPHVKTMVEAVRAHPRTAGVKIVVGGRPFIVDPDLVAAVGADGWASDARGAVDTCNGLVGVPGGG